MEFEDSIPPIPDSEATEQHTEPEHPSHEPAIAWDTVIDSTDDDGLSESSTQSAMDPNHSDVPESESAEWTGPVIVVETTVATNSQNGRSSIFMDSPRHSLLNKTRVFRRYMVIKSPYLCQVLSSPGLIQYYPSFHEMISKQLAKGTMTIPEPFAVLLHNFDTIKTIADANSVGMAPAYESEHDDNVKQAMIDHTKRHMKHLVDILEPVYQEVILTYQKHLSDPVPKVAFDMIWYLLKPGTDVYVQIDGSTHAAVVMDVKPNGLSQFNIVNVNWWLVYLWRLETDGSRIHRASISADVHSYSGLREVTDLPVCPVYAWDSQDGGERRKQILQRSATFLKALHEGNLLADYNGPIKGTNRYYTGKVVIDHRRGLGEPHHRRPRSLHVEDYSDRFQEHNSIIVNNDWSLHAPPPTDMPEESEKDLAIARLEKLVLDDRADREAKEAHRLATIERKAAEDAYAAQFSHHPTDNIRQGRAESIINEPPVVWETIHCSRPYESQYTESPGAGLYADIVSELTEHQLLLLSPDAFAYALRYKQWILISFDYVQESVPSDEIISNLVINRNELRTIQALSNRQNSKTKHWSVDFVDGKGSGQIILLHGPSGVGKTYTVEAISEWLHRPLLALTVADIGTVETLVEEQLTKWFNLAEAWNAVLLVDEADIFLERRQNRDIARNGLVSAFLRQMEYFKGLLFLTTNRVGQIDDAFISRVHVAIGYKPLDEETRRKVWSGFFRKLVRERAGKIQISPDAKAWVLQTCGETQLNGRDIRNALQTAITLAEFENEDDPDYDPDASLVTIVTKEHFQNVLERCNKFRNYVTSIRREDEQKRAQGRGDRNDYGYKNGIANEMGGLSDLAKVMGRP